MEQDNLQEKAIFQDILASEKILADAYNLSAGECATLAVRDGFISLLNEEHQLQADVFSELQKRGWYPVQQAQQQQINRIKQKYSNIKP